MRQVICDSWSVSSDMWCRRWRANWSAPSDVRQVTWPSWIIPDKVLQVMWDRWHVPGEVPWLVCPVLCSQVAQCAALENFFFFSSCVKFSPLLSLSRSVNTFVRVTSHLSGVSVSRELGWRYWPCTDHRLSPQRRWVLQRHHYTMSECYESTNELFLFSLLFPRSILYRMSQ